MPAHFSDSTLSPPLYWRPVEGFQRTHSRQYCSGRVGACLRHHNISFHMISEIPHVYLFFLGSETSANPSDQFVHKPGPGIPTSSTPNQQPALAMPQFGERATSGPETLSGGGHTHLIKIQSFANSVLWTGRAILSNTSTDDMVSIPRPRGPLPHLLREI